MRKIHTKIRIDISTGQVKEDEFFWYDGPVAMCGEDDDDVDFDGWSDPLGSLGDFGSGPLGSVGVGGSGGADPSGMAGLFDVMTGVPQAMASTTGIPKDSQSETRMSALAHDISTAMSSLHI